MLNFTLGVDILKPSLKITCASIFHEFFSNHRCFMLATYMDECNLIKVANIKHLWLEKNSWKNKIQKKQYSWSSNRHPSRC